MTLPNHVASEDEAIPPQQESDTAPDMALATPILTMLADLAALRDDVVGYVERWRHYLTTVGGYASLSIDAWGERHLEVGMPCDSQVRHRSRWLHFLSEDLRVDPEQRNWLLKVLLDEGRFLDHRPANARETTAAIRDFLRAEGRILVDPAGKLTTGAGVPRKYTHGSDEDAAEVVRASRAYFQVRNRYRSEPQIRRAVRMLGHQQNGWMVLEAPHAS